MCVLLSYCLVCVIEVKIHAQKKRGTILARLSSSHAFVPGKSFHAVYTAYTDLFFGTNSNVGK